ncbi:hypothetical protein MUK42_17084 [Musa troglodytarum]|uniref:Uncharacterized protein n=1 Tax=Musa troglodytarum TaxID=320322 RepID=A0A9E7L3R7_9LILI|nr:hypothetical protein MUK42_17084 [Musa troglodytarum]
MTNVRKGQLCLCTKPEASASSPFVSPHVEVRVYVLYLFSLPTSAALTLCLHAACAIRIAAAMKPTVHKPPPAAVGLVCLAVVLLAFVYLVIYPKEFELQSFVTACRPSSSAAAASFTEPVTVKPDFRLLLGPAPTCTSDATSSASFTRSRPTSPPTSMSTSSSAT